VAGPRRSTQDRRQQRARNAAFSLFITSGLLGRLLEEELDSSGLTPNDLGMLSAIGMPGGITPSALAEQLGVRQSTLTTRIQALVDRRLVRRVSHPVDGRSYQLELTAAGTRAWEDAAAALRASLSRIERALAVPIDDVEEALVELERALRATLEDGTTS
jgi:DNA-binding MarR family transcriptional regulator